MPIDRSIQLSISQMAELIGIDPAGFIGFEVDRQSSTITVLLEEKQVAKKAKEMKVWLNQRERSLSFTKAHR